MPPLGSARLVSNRWLTVSGEPVERLHNDAVAAYERNERRWMAGRHRVHERPVRMEPLSYTYRPQVPDPNVYQFSGQRGILYGHPDTIARLVTASPT